MVINIVRTCHLLDFPVVHYDNAICHRHGFSLIMGDIDDCRLQPLVKLADFRSHCRS